MTTTISRIALALILLLPSYAAARQEQSEPNVNSRYKVQRVSVTGAAESALSQALREDMQKLVGKPFDQAAADDLARRMREQLRGYRVTVKVKRGDEPESVNVEFQAERHGDNAFYVAVAPLLYTTKDAFTINLLPTVETHHNYFLFGLVSDADQYLERNMGVVLRYEHHKVGTRMVQVGFGYDYFHPSFQPETEAALALNPLVPGVYRTREVFEPSVSVLPLGDNVKVTFGASFQTLAMQYPVLQDQAANSFTFDVRFRRQVRPSHRVTHAIEADYSVRNASTSLESDFLYTRQLVSARYEATVGRNGFDFRFQAGHLDGAAPLFERFILGNTSTLRGWDKFEIAPLGATRMAHGSLEYRYRPFVAFYDFGAAWEPNRDADVKHSVGIGLAWRNGFFMTLGVPLRYENVTPVFMFGFRPKRG